MKNDSIIFDLDGTLWDATAAITDAWNGTLDFFGTNRKVTLEDIRGVTGKPARACIEALIPEILNKHKDFPELLSVNARDALIKKGGKLYPEVQNIIPLLASKYSLFIVSNCNEWYLDFFFQQSGLKDFFKDADCFGKSQAPKSEMIRSLLKRYDLKTPVYVGDTASDQQAANEVGVDFIFCTYGFGKTENPKNSINSFQELTELL